MKIKHIPSLLTHYLTRIHGPIHHIDPALEGCHLEQADVGREDAVKVHI